jgi:hypothetical protein
MQGGSGEKALRRWLFPALVLGSLWGLSEVVLNDAAVAWGLPIRAGLLAGVGMLLMGGAVGFTGAVLSPLLMAGTAVVMKQMAVPILHVSILCKANSCIAVALQASFVGLLLRSVGLGRVGRLRASAIGASAGLGSALVFWNVGLRVAPCTYLLSFQRPGGLAAFLGTEGLVWAVGGALLLPAGLALGRRLRLPLGGLELERPALYRRAGAGVLLASWAAAALAIAASGMS